MIIRKKLNQAGDTIIEVLIAIVILSFVLAGAYSSSQYSLNTIRNSQNKITALNFAQNQIELLKTWASNSANFSQSSYPYILAGDGFYMNSSNDTPTPINNPYTVPSLKHLSTLEPSPSSSNYAFNYYVVNTPANQQINGNYTFEVYVEWTNLNTRQQDNTDLYYRMAL